MDLSFVNLKESITTLPQEAILPLLFVDKIHDLNVVCGVVE